MSDLISRQAAIDAICNACGKIDCDKMDKCEKLQLPPANCSEFPNNSDTISRQAAIESIGAVFPVDSMKSEYAQGIACGAALAKTYIEQLPSAQPEQRWIPCSEKLPKRGENVLVTRDYDGREDNNKSCRYVEVASCYGEDDDITWNSFSDEYKMHPKNHHVIAWMPLPECYRGEEK